MKCPECGKTTDVKDTRLRDYGMRRRRECKHCGRRFSTVEITDDEYNYLSNGLELNKETVERLKKVYSNFEEFMEFFLTKGVIK